MSRLIDCKTGWRSVRFDEALIKECANSGIEVLEHDCSWNDEDCDQDYVFVQQTAKKYGIYMQSVHLAMGERLDISSEEYGENTVKVMKKQIEKAGKAGVRYAVLHASSEPIEDWERNARLERAIKNIKILCEYADENGIVLCVEDLPRTCLCNNIDEMRAVLESDDRLMVCFDVNHLLKCSHREFVDAFGDRIVTTHICDYDFVDDRHWIPGDGKIDWAELCKLLEGIDYKGAFLYECDVDRRKGKKALPRTAYRKIHENIANGLPPLYTLE